MNVYLTGVRFVVIWVTSSKNVVMVSIPLWHWSLKAFAWSGSEDPVAVLAKEEEGEAAEGEEDREEALDAVHHSMIITPGWRKKRM